MFTPASGATSAVADLNAQVASLQASIRILKQRMDQLEASLNRALESAGLAPPTPKSGGTDSGEKVE